MSVLYVGDSLGVGTSPHVKGAKADVKGGRRSSEAAKIAASKFRGERTIVFDVGTNDASAGELRRSVRKLRKAVGQDVAILMSPVRGPHAATKNQVLRQLERKGAIRLFAGGKVEVSGDGIHPTPAGYQARAKALRKALKRGGPGRPQGSRRLDKGRVDLIDGAFRDGANIDEVFMALEKSGDRNPNDTFDRYLRTPAADGRPRAQINLKDPLEWADVDKANGQPTDMLSDQQFAAIELKRQEGAELDEVHEALAAAGLDPDAALKEYLQDPRRRMPARTAPRNPESPDGWEF